MQGGLFDNIEMETVEIKEDEMGQYSDFNKYFLKDFGDEDTYTGKPIMGEPYSFEFEDQYTGKKKTLNKVKLAIINEEDSEYLDIGISLKKESNIQEKIFKGSILFDFISSLMELQGISIKEGTNVLKNINLESIKEFINSKEIITIKVSEEEGDDFTYNSFKVIKIN